MIDIFFISLNTPMQVFHQGVASRNLHRSCRLQKSFLRPRFRQPEKFPAAQCAMYRRQYRGIISRTEINAHRIPSAMH